MALRKNTLPDALALRMVNKGRSHFEQPHVTGALYGYYDYAPVDDIVAGKPHIVPNAEGEALLAQSPLWAAHRRLLEMGYQRDHGSNPIKSRLGTKRYIPYKRWDDGNERYDTAWISASGSKPAIFISRLQREGGSYQLEESK
jgi:hypothetical protein